MLTRVAQRRTALWLCVQGRHFASKPKPAEPDSQDCCGNGCKDCVWVDYSTALEEWQRGEHSSEAQAVQVGATGPPGGDMTGGRDSGEHDPPAEATAADPAEGARLPEAEPLTPRDQR